MGTTVAERTGVSTAIFGGRSKINVMRTARSKQRARGRQSAAGLFLVRPARVSGV